MDISFYPFFYGYPCIDVLWILDPGSYVCDDNIIFFRICSGQAEIILRMHLKHYIRFIEERFVEATIGFASCFSFWIYHSTETNEFEIMEFYDQNHKPITVWFEDTVLNV